VKTGVQKCPKPLDSGFRRNDEISNGTLSFLS
jgi:hypothetical protein